jgi:hypothetical protein
VYITIFSFARLQKLWNIACSKELDLIYTSVLKYNICMTKKMHVIFHNEPFYYILYLHSKFSQVQDVYAVTAPNAC